MKIALNLLIYALCGALKKFDLKLFKVGTWREYLIAAFIVAICLFVRFGDFETLRGYFT